MKKHSKKRISKIVRSLNKRVIGGGSLLPKSNKDNFDFIKVLVKNNIENRFEEHPAKMNDYTIGRHNIDILNRHVDLTNNIEDFQNEILQPIFSKGFERLFELYQFLNNTVIWKNMEDYKSLLVSQFIIINQVFGDGNHRAALFVLNHYSKYSPETIDIIMSVTDRIHKWNGDLKKKQF